MTISLMRLTSCSRNRFLNATKVDALREHFSEFGLIRRRLQVEVEWLKALAAEFQQWADNPLFLQTSEIRAA